MWEALLDDGTVARETECKWGDIKGQVVGLSFLYHGVVHSLPKNQVEYFRAKTASALLSGGEAVVESEWIGCRLADWSVLRLRFDSRKKEVSVEIEREGRQ